MSPDRGQQEFSPPANMRDYFDALEKSTEGQEYDCKSALLEDTVIPETKTHCPSTSPPRFTGNYISHYGASHKNALESQASPKYTAPSVKSMSSTENSRRDSAISAESQRRRRPKSSRSDSKRSMQSAPGGEMSRTTSSGGKQRPRGHRFASSTSINVPHTNIEEALALHARSCEIFSVRSRPSTAYATPPATSPYGSYTSSGHYHGLSSADALPMSRFSSEQGSPYQRYGNGSTWDVADEEDQYYTTSFPPTVMHWTSDEARMKEYAAIDRSNSGVRGLLKKFLPMCVSKKHGNFYNEKDDSDSGSVRRIRLDFSVDKEEPKRSNMPRQFSVC